MSAPVHALRIGKKEEMLSAYFFFDKHKPSGHLSMHGFGKKWGGRNSDSARQTNTRCAGRCSRGQETPEARPASFPRLRKSYFLN